ncbi:Uncharacterized protein FWK35_00015926 [Aphis craccivora]|uniref:Uncharacterized protein n=1 Tax=Aphis craccivora TaxID=307492 RepID=A0A6G0ZHF9_APHCR|nr:Uncharacterized protein FWK35_00015926 [Aphis craccivora]
MLKITIADCKYIELTPVILNTNLFTLLITFQIEPTIRQRKQNFYITKPASKIKLIILLMTISELVLRMKEKLRPREIYLSTKEIEINFLLLYDENRKKSYKKLFSSPVIRAIFTPRHLRPGPRAANVESIDHIHVISLDPPVRLDEKPPDYASVVDLPPPSYDDAIKLDPQRLMDRGHRTAATDTCSVTVVPPDECDKTSSGNNESADNASSQPTAKLAQAIRKSIRDIRKQLTNTVGDGTDVEQQQQQSGSAVHRSDLTVPTALRKPTDGRTAASNAPPTAD